MKDDIFSIEFPSLIEPTDLGIIATGCVSNSSHYASGTNKSDCCCVCEKRDREG